MAKRSLDPIERSRCIHSSPAQIAVVSCAPQRLMLHCDIRTRVLVLRISSHGRVRLLVLGVSSLDLGRSKERPSFFAWCVPTALRAAGVYARKIPAANGGARNACRGEQAKLPPCEKPSVYSAAARRSRRAGTSVKVRAITSAKSARRRSKPRLGRMAASSI